MHPDLLQSITGGRLAEDHARAEARRRSTGAVPARHRRVLHWPGHHRRHDSRAGAPAIDTR